MPPLRIAVLAQPGVTFEDWEVRLFERIRRNSELDLVAIVEPPAQETKAGRAGGLGAILRLERAVLLRRLKRSAPPTIENVPTTDWKKGELPEVDILLSHVRQGWPRIHGIEAREVWGYGHYTRGRHWAFGSVEVAEGQPVTRIELLQNVGNRVVQLDVSTTNTKFFGAFNAEYAKDKLVALVDRALRRRARGAELGALPAVENVSRETRTIRYVLSVAKAIARRMATAAAGRLGARTEDWTLLVGKGDIFENSLDDLTELEQPDTEFRADPFLFQYEAKTFVFFEAYPLKSRKGRIRVGRLDGARLVDETELEFGDIHLSYPFVFDDGDSIFMIPETHQRDRVEVWRATCFPSKWELYATALEGRSPADTTLFKHEDAWWLATSFSSGGFEDHGQELHVFRTSGPDLKELEPHVDNPVVIDTLSARNGGRPFLGKGGLYRPAQMASHGHYGHGITLMRVEELSLETFREVPALTITPDLRQGTTGCHHVDVGEGIFILDARRAIGSRLLGAKAIRLRSKKI